MRNPKKWRTMYHSMYVVPTLRCQINASPRLLIFWIFSNLLDFIRTPRLLSLRTLTIYTNPSFPFFVSTIYANFNGKIAYCSIYLSFMLYDNLFLFFPSLHNHLKPFLKFRPSPRLLEPSFIKFWNLFRPLCLLGHPVYLALESTLLGLNLLALVELLLCFWCEGSLVFTILCLILLNLLRGSSYSSSQVSQVVGCIPIGPWCNVNAAWPRRTGYDSREQIYLYNIIERDLIYSHQSKWGRQSICSFLGRLLQR